MTTKKNVNLHKAKKEKNDEFYTQLSDIENEVKYYRNYFKGKTVLLNCDDPEESMFWTYFAMNFEFLGLKKLISTHFNTSGSSYKLELMYDINNDGKIDKLDTIKTPLIENGDFRSVECIKILEECDIVVTNPPFSLFREFIQLLIKYNKKFLVIGNMNAVTYKEIFKLIQENKIWLGVTPRGLDFLLPDGNMSNINATWFTNLEHKKRNEELTLFRSYHGNETGYTKYDNYDVIEVSKVQDIPKDYNGIMGVPITFLDKYNPSQFEILGVANSARWIGYECYTLINGKKIYNRFLIKKIC